MCGILTPDSGICKINGLIPYKDRKKYVKDIGVVFGNRSALWWDVPVEDSFELIKEIYGISDETYKRQKNMLVEMLNIKEIIKTPTRQLSLGQRMRCEIAAAFLHEPKIVFLDEPTIGLDSISKIAVRDFVKKINKEKNTTIILTTHDTGDIEALTKRVILIGKGKLLLDGSFNNLIKKYIKFNNLTKTDKKINIYSDMNFVKRKRISINKGNATTHHRAYMMDLILEGDLDLIEFAYDVGIGEKNSMGFGMIKLLE